MQDYDNLQNFRAFANNFNRSRMEGAKIVNDYAYAKGLGLTVFLPGWEEGLFLIKNL